MLNSQHRLQQSSQHLHHHHHLQQQQHQQQLLQHSAAPTGSNGSIIITNSSSGSSSATNNNNHNNNNDSTPEYFIFDDLTTALQERSNIVDQTTSPSSSSMASTTTSGTAAVSTPITTPPKILLHQPLQQHLHHHHLHQQHQQQQQQQQHQQQHHHQHQHHHQQQQQESKCCFGDTTYHFKTLVPAVAAGAIIGKGGETIAAVQKESGARVKMSKSHDFYPGTTERVCLITGSVEAISSVLDFIMDKIREKPDLTNKLSDNEAKQGQDRDRQVKILVPNSTAGMIIGKSGAYIKQIKEESGSYVQISQKPRDITLQERCITIIGDPEKNKIACKLILAKIIEDPQSGTCLNVSYADVNGPVANFNPTGSPYASNQNSISSSTASLNSTVGGNLLVNGSGLGLNISLNLGAASTPNPQITPQILEHIKASMRGSGYSEPATNEVCQAFAILAKYGILGSGVGLPHPNGTHHATPLSYLGVSALEHAVPTGAGGVFGAIGQVNLDSFIGQTSPTPRSSLERFETAAFDPFRHVGQQATAPISLNNNSFGLATGTQSVQAIGPATALGVLSKSPTPGDVGNKETKNVEVPEIIVGAILGPSGRNLVEIQSSSGATIQISKKGIFSPGTRNRIVTITGQTSAITRAEILIEQAIQMEETKRASQNVMTGIMQ